MDFFKEHSFKQNESFLARTKRSIAANIYIYVYISGSLTEKFKNKIRSLLWPDYGPYGRLFLLEKGGTS